MDHKYATETLFLDKERAGANSLYYKYVIDSLFLDKGWVGANSLYQWSLTNPDSIKIVNYGKYRIVLNFDMQRAFEFALYLPSGGTNFYARIVPELNTIIVAMKNFDISDSELFLSDIKDLIDRGLFNLVPAVDTVHYARVSKSKPYAWHRDSYRMLRLSGK